LDALIDAAATPGRLLHALADHPSPAVRQALAARTKFGSSHR
jgi:hypothetical protein